MHDDESTDITGHLVLLAYEQTFPYHITEEILKLTDLYMTAKV